MTTMVWLSHATTARSARRTVAPGGVQRVLSGGSVRRSVKVDLWSVTKLSLCFYISAMFVPWSR